MAYIKCPNCQYEGNSKRFIKGSVIVELFLWLCMILPGFLYSLWRISTKYEGCPNCKFPNVYPIPKPQPVPTLQK